MLGTKLRGALLQARGGGEAIIELRFEFDDLTGDARWQRVEIGERCELGAGLVDFDGEDARNLSGWLAGLS